MAHDSRNPALLAREDDSRLVGERALNHVPSLGSATTPELGMVSPEPEPPRSSTTIRRHPYAKSGGDRQPEDSTRERTAQIGSRIVGTILIVTAINLMWR
jgi:hypothetical protein